MQSLALPKDDMWDLSAPAAQPLAGDLSRLCHLTPQLSALNKAAWCSVTHSMKCEVYQYSLCPDGVWPAACRGRPLPAHRPAEAVRPFFATFTSKCTVCRSPACECLSRSVH